MKQVPNFSCPVLQNDSIYIILISQYHTKKTIFEYNNKSKFLILLVPCYKKIGCIYFSLYIYQEAHRHSCFDEISSALFSLFFYFRTLGNSFLLCPPFCFAFTGNYQFVLRCVYLFPVQLMCLLFHYPCFDFEVLAV